mmetsp:Transcript_25421/g.45915  ORF Transcript_25421/g.45915 Transcript_25421/m.45915 type:complete len:230 (-) Transcript_25421:186-875(-)
MHSRAYAAPFLDQLDAAKQLDGVGLFLVDQFVSHDEAENAFQTLNDGIPWNLTPSLYGEKLSQHAYHHFRNNKNSAYKRAEKSAAGGLTKLEDLCTNIEKYFDGKVSDVYCNRFMNPEHHIPYHTDTFGRHVIVLSLGSHRTVNFRNKKTKHVTEVRPKAGDLYFMPLRVNDSYEHCVCAANKEDLASDDGNDTRLSFVFFFEPPKYAKDYKITKIDKIRGFLEGILSG